MVMLLPVWLFVQQRRLAPGLYKVSILINSKFPPEDWVFSIPLDQRSEIVAKSDFLVRILPPLGLQDHLSNFVNSWITPITGLWTFLAGVAAVIGPLAIRMYRNRQKRKKEIR
jgi:hypothetical protein